MTRALREISDAILWYEARSCWRFAYRDPFTLERKFAFCLPDKFREFGIALRDPDVVRKPTKLARELCAKLQRAFLDGLRQVRPEASEATQTPEAAKPIMLSEAIEKFHAMYDHRAPSYEAGLRAICDEFLDSVGDKPIERVTDEDLKAYERRIAQRVCTTTVRSYIRQLSMLLRFGVRKGWIREDPRLTYRLPREELRDPNPFTDEEIRAFFDLCRTPVPGHPNGWGHLEFIGTGLLCLGLRPIEMQHARWENIHWDERFIFIAKSHGAKERQARQMQPIPLAAMPAFEAHRKEAGYVWAGYFGRPVTPTMLSRARESIKKQIPGFQWKRFRKTFATIVAAANDDMMVSRLLRHSAGGTSSTMASKHYVGKSHALLRAAVDEAFEPYGAMVSGGVGVEATLGPVQPPFGPESNLALIAKLTGVPAVSVSV